jgi:pSer/pThr/pTyr-binding forkhead associated (FHA) protein
MRKVRVAKGTDERDVPLEGSLLVGRDARCDIQDSDPELSRRHAEFVVKGRDIVVRDLNSRNGIRVNGVRMQEAVLRPGDVVQVAKLRMKYVDDALDEETQHGSDESDERTVVMPPPAASHRPPPAAPERSSPAVRQESPAPSPGPVAAPAASQSDDKTMLLSSPPKPGPVAAAPKPAPPPAASAKRGASWGARVLIQTLMLAIVVFLMTWVPMVILHGRLLNETAFARASALAQWLASEAAANLAAGGKGLADVGVRVAKEPGVVAYLIVSPKGDVWAPTARAREPVTKLPGIGVAPSEIFRMRAEWNGDLLEVALPVAVGDDPRVAVAALTFRPSTAPGGTSSAFLLGPILVATLVLGWLVAVGLRRRTLAALTRFNEDVELLLGGQLTSVADPMGTKPTKELADLVNHLVSRGRTGESSGTGRGTMEMAPPPRSPSAPGSDRGASATPGSRSREAPKAPGPEPPTPPPPALAQECHVVASATFRVVEASPTCGDILGIPPEALVGRHVLDAIPDKGVLDAILKCLSKLPAGGEERMTVALEGRPFRLSIMVGRPAKDQPITITFTRVDGERT